MLDLIRERWSPRAFDATREVTMDDLWRLFEAARWAPSSRNEQPWRFVVAHRQQSPATYQALFAALGASNQAWAGTAPVLILAAVQLTVELTGEANRMMRARASRAAVLPGARRPGAVWQARVVGNMVGALFIRSYERSERVYLAMQSRGYSGHVRHIHDRPFPRPQLAILAMAVAVLAVFEISAHAWLPHA
ncbi:MAG TPA: nitroreductase family protein [Tepidiformaceae bacterium]|nr:nitroreductase family protein [Tepidiformaceae bacterium]